MTERPNESASTEDFEFDALREANNYRRALLKLFAPHLRGRVIEVGAGIGQFTAQLRELPQIKRLLAIEPDPKFCAEFRKTLPDQPLIEGVITSMTELGPWNGILSVNVLEHIREDENELALYSKMLAHERGRLCLFVPARQEIYAPIEIDFGHHRRYSRIELRKKLERAGFKILHLHYFNFIGYFAWWFSFRLMGQKKFNPAMVRLFDRAIFPFGFGIESHICWPPIGQSLVAIAEASA
jgi:SAM-dependent methyltransferase